MRIGVKSMEFAKKVSRDGVEGPAKPGAAADGGAVSPFLNSSLQSPPPLQNLAVGSMGSQRTIAYNPGARSLFKNGRIHMSTETKTPLHHVAGGGTSNRDWWPNQLKLELLHQHSSLSNPMGED